MDTAPAIGVEERLQTLHEVIAAARRTLARNVGDYGGGGGGTETRWRLNRAALDRVALRPRVLRDVSSVDPSGSFQGQRTRLPVVLAPVGGLEALGPGGGVTVARAAGAAGVPFYLSSVTDSGMEAVAAAASGPKVFQLYVRGDAAWIDEHVRLAVACGYDAFCITVDTAHYSRRERDIANRFSKPWRARAPGMEYQAALCWGDIRRFRDKHDMPLVLKGIATAEDAALACELGVQGIYVSNHGGRQLDHGLGAVDLLAEIVPAVAGRAHITVDGGICRGTDVVKAVALGADTVGIGRLYCYGFAAAGQEGIERVMDLLETEVVECLGLLGAKDFNDLDRSFLRAAEPVFVPGVHSAFPLLDPAERLG